MINYLQYGAMLYDSRTGRFLSVDPMFEQFREHTPYHYAFNSPVQWRDPSGLYPVDEKGERVQALEIEIEDLMDMELAENLGNEVLDQEEIEGERFFNFMMKKISGLSDKDIYGARYGEQVNYVGRNTFTSTFVYISGQVIDVSIVQIYETISLLITVTYSTENGLTSSDIEYILKENLDLISNTPKGFDVLNTVGDLFFDISYTGKELANLWCRDISNWLGGFCYNIWKEGAMSEDGIACGITEMNWVEEGVIYLAEEWFYDDFNIDQYVEDSEYSFVVASPGLGLTRDKKKYTLYMAISHEIGHRYDSIVTPSGANIDAEKSANEFMFYIWRRLNPGYKIVRY